jgi:hypothetical protein
MTTLDARNGILGITDKGKRMEKNGGNRGAEISISFIKKIPGQIE